jgi:hypothetical protein
MGAPWNEVERWGASRGEPFVRTGGGPPEAPLSWHADQGEGSRRSRPGLDSEGATHHCMEAIHTGQRRWTHAGWTGRGARVGARSIQTAGYMVVAPAGLLAR